MITAIFDCMIFLQAANNRKGAAGGCLTFVDEGHVDLFVSPVILDEVAEVLQRPAVRASFPKLTDEHIENFLTDVREISNIEEDAPPVYSLPIDPDDEPYVNLAIAKQPSFLVTWDRHLLPLMSNEDFLKRFAGVSILNPPAFLSHVRAEISKELGYE